MYDNASRRVAWVDALGNRSTTVYNDADRVIESVDARERVEHGGRQCAGNCSSPVAGRVVLSVRTGKVSSFR